MNRHIQFLAGNFVKVFLLFSFRFLLFLEIIPTFSSKATFKPVYLNLCIFRIKEDLCLESLQYLSNVKKKYVQERDKVKEMVSLCITRGPMFRKFTISQ